MSVVEETRRKLRGEVVRNRSVCELTSFCAGGSVDYCITLREEDALGEAIVFCQKEKLPFVIVGSGSKLLFRDDGFRGAVIRLCGDFSQIHAEDTQLIVGAGVGLPRLLSYAADSELSGLEFLAGIPGTVGGAVVRNAGAFGESLSERIATVRVLNTCALASGQTCLLRREQMEFAYRSSCFLQRRELVITEVCLQLKSDNARSIRGRIEQASKRKKQTQPLSYPSAGCVFKNPAHYSAGYLIQNTGCLGMRQGDAQVSFQHGNFIINRGQATASDIIVLMDRVRCAVEAKFGIKLEPEIEIL